MVSVNSASQTVRYEVVKLRELEQIRHLLHNDFYPDEPTSASMKISEGNGYLDKLLRKEAHAYDFENAIKLDKEPMCLVAKQSSGGTEEIVGLMAATIHCKDESMAYKDSKLKLFARLPKYAPVPLKVMQGINFLKLRDDVLKFNPKYLFEQFKDADKICEGLVLCVARNGRRKGIGLELVKKSLELARTLKCDYYVTMATSNYSQKLFIEKFNFECSRQISYKDHTIDERGRPFLDNTAEHESIKILTYDLGMK